MILLVNLKKGFRNYAVSAKKKMKQLYNISQIKKLCFKCCCFFMKLTHIKKKGFVIYLDILYMFRYSQYNILGGIKVL